MNRHVAVMLVCTGIASCNPGLPTGPDVDVDFSIIDAPTTPLMPAARRSMNGVYQVLRGQGIFGDIVVGMWVGNRWCVYAQQDVVFAVSAGGARDSTVELLGYYRSVRSGSGARMRFTIEASDGALDLLAGKDSCAVRISGQIDGGDDIDFRRIRSANASPCVRLGHRGGSRNSERLGISENSIDMIKYAPLMGANGVEIDVKRTRDNQLIVFHDDSFSPRTVQGTYLLGKVDNFDLAQIRSLGRLVNGEPIPTLRELLTAVIRDTELSLVWLDIKDAATMDSVVRIQQEMLDYAGSIERQNLTILVGIPTPEVLTAWLPYQNISDALCEYDPNVVTTYDHIHAWAPIWTVNISAAEVQQVHRKGKMVLPWTVDVREGMLDFLNRADSIDGILTNYPSLLTALHDARE